MKPIVSLLLACALITACSERDPVDKQANKSGVLPAIDENAPDATGSAPANNAQPAGKAPESAAVIPAALRGRWALAPMDCTSKRGDAKGLLTINSDELRFYESRAVPGAKVQTASDSISGDFTFTGEGETWTKFVALELKGPELVRTETNPVASFTYVQCR